MSVHQRQLSPDPARHGSVPEFLNPKEFWLDPNASNLADGSIVLMSFSINVRTLLASAMTLG
jgi:hypothetical protein